MKAIRVVADYHDLCGECPVWDADTKTLFWTDILGRRFYRYDASSKEHEIVTEGLEINGFRLNRGGGFIITNSEGIWRWDGHMGLQLIAGEVDGFACKMNDCIADPYGRLFAGSKFYAPDREYELGKLIRIDNDGRATIIDEGFHLSNGLGFSPDCKTLYFTDSIARRIYAYNFDVESGDISHRRTLVKVPDDEGIPDGLTVDAQGFIWSAQWYGSCVVRYDPDGKVERKIMTPAKQTSSIAFGGDWLTECFITSAGESGPLPVMPPGYDPTSGYFGGALYCIDSDIEGKLEYRANISPTG